MQQPVSLVSALTLVVLAACAAPNPKPTNEPAAWRPPAENKAKEPAAAATNAQGAATTPGASARDSAGTNAANANGASTNPAVTNSASTAPPAGAAPAQKPAGTADAVSTEPIVARVAGQPVYVSELLSQWLYLDNFRVLDQLRNIAMSRIVLAEASRLRVTIDADKSSTAYESAVAAIENEIKGSEMGRKTPNLTLDSYVDRVMGLDPIRYRERLRDDALRALLAERVTRAWLLQQEHAEIHVLVVGSEDEVKAAQKDLADGKSFEEVARARSIDPSKTDGGRITPILRGTTPLAKAAFDSPIGAVGGPITASGAWLLFRVDARPTPVEGDWSRIGPLVEDSLKQRPVDSLEGKQWHSSMVERYEVDLKPFLDLVREPAR